MAGERGARSKWAALPHNDNAKPAPLFHAAPSPRPLPCLYLRKALAPRVRAACWPAVAARTGCGGGDARGRRGRQVAAAGAGPTGHSPHQQRWRCPSMGVLADWHGSPRPQENVHACGGASPGGATGSLWGQGVGDKGTPRPQRQRDSGTHRDTPHLRYKSEFPPDRRR